MAALKGKKIVWPEELDDPKTELLTISVDGVDFNMNVDSKACSKKFNGCPAKYEIALSVHHPNVFIWLAHSKAEHMI
jgi:hypothetical protein